jgi:hypothetical protein
MAKYAKVKENTEAYDLLYKIWNYTKKWDEHNEEIEEFLGFKSNKSLYYNVNNLVIDRTYLPDEWEPQFKKNTYPAEAKTKSKLRLAWIELCKRLGLETYSVRDFSFKYGLYFNKVTLHNMNDEYYLEFRDEGVEVSSFKFDWIDEIEEPKFLRIKADFLENQKSA